MDLNRVYTWQMPAKLVFGPGCCREAGKELKGLGGRKVLIITDRGVEGAGVLGGILEGLASSGLHHAIYNGVEPNPSTRCVEEAATLYLQEGCDCLMAVGGGSSIDTAKVCGAVVANDVVDVRLLEGVGKFVKPLPPFVAVPTTCGTGAEATFFAVITDTERHYKMAIGSPLLVPRVAVIDASLLTGLPGLIVASTGLDALCHAVESYTNLNAQPISDCLDLASISMISSWLRPAVANGNLEALAHMVLASTVAGMGFTNTRLTIVHAMSHPISGYFGVPHGVANAILLPYVMEFNLIGSPQRFGDIARAMGEDTSGLTTMEAARLSVKAVRDLSRDVGIPDSLKAFGVSEERLPNVLEDTFKSGNVALNPVRVTRDQVAEIFRRAMK